MHGLNSILRSGMRCLQNFFEMGIEDTIIKLLLWRSCSNMNLTTTFLENFAEEAGALS
jgi:hypothetical protein